MAGIKIACTEHICRTARRSFALYRFDPIPLFRKRIDRQVDALWHYLAVQLLPIHIHSLDPKGRQVGEFPGGDPFVDNGFLHLFILVDETYIFLATLSLSLIDVLA